MFWPGMDELALRKHRAVCPKAMTEHCLVHKLTTSIGSMMPLSCAALFARGRSAGGAHAHSAHMYCAHPVWCAHARVRGCWGRDVVVDACDNIKPARSRFV